MMKADAPILLFGSLAVILFDTIGSLASRAFGFKYRSLVVGSWVIYAAVGFFAARYRNLWSGIVDAAFVGIVDATIGWAISWWIGPGRPDNDINASVAVRVVFIVMITAAAWGLAGSIVGRLFAERSL